jgi:Na+/H+-dicarboxylate symporter
MKFWMISLWQDYIILTLFLTMSSFIIYVILTEICSINNQRNYSKFFRSQEKEILVSFNGTIGFEI